MQTKFAGAGGGNLTLKMQAFSGNPCLTHVGSTPSFNKNIFKPRGEVHLNLRSKVATKCFLRGTRKIKDFVGKGANERYRVKFIK